MSRNDKIYLTDLQKKAIEIMYDNAEISQIKLVKKLDSTASSIHMLIKRIMTWDPPLINIRKIGKFTYYSLTEAGRSYHEELNKIDAKSDSEKKLNLDIKKLMISYITCSSYNRDIPPLAQKLVEMDTEIIAREFTLQEFIYLAVTIGLLTEKDIKENDSTLFAAVESQSIQELLCLKKFLNLVNSKPATNDIEKIQKSI